MAGSTCFIILHITVRIWLECNTSLWDRKKQREVCIEHLLCHYLQRHRLSGLILEIFPIHCVDCYYNGIKIGIQQNLGSNKQNMVLCRSRSGQSLMFAFTQRPIVISAHLLLYPIFNHIPHSKMSRDVHITLTYTLTWSLLTGSGDQRWWKNIYYVLYIKNLVGFNHALTGSLDYQECS